ncbi:hypothetical protein ACO0QE_002658 [Hanseniaspora vineae]
MMFFLRTSTGDPGVLPRNVHQLETYCHLENENEKKEKDSPVRYPEEYTDTEYIIPMVEFNDSNILKTPYQEQIIKYCKTCKIWKLSKTHHCSTCQCDITEIVQQDTID